MGYYDSPDFPEDVSPCCGSDNWEETQDEEGYTIYKCFKCNETFDEPESEYEYDERMKEMWAEMRADEERLERGNS
tara:strand:+ start:1007 stop:1234 length:228 start_codon:yes stop_codon:yes gene_type:complete